MKALSLRQPWAQLLALGIRTFDIRSWRTGQRGRIFLHAGFSTLAQLRPVCANPWVVQNLKDNGLTVETLPRQALVGEVGLADCVPLEEFTFPQECGPLDLPDRGWVWLFENPAPLPWPIPYPGRLGLFDTFGVRGKEKDGADKASEPEGPSRVQA
ncbi:MAG: hypothetical protein EXR99_08615 [Gemmataceae bacterium]|nr:hypothetical protein [Gemmataceae bacterium]